MPASARPKPAICVVFGRPAVTLANTTGSVAVTTAAVGATVAALPIARPRYKQARPTAPTSPADAAQPELASDGGASPIAHARTSRSTMPESADSART